MGFDQRSGRDLLELCDAGAQLMRSVLWQKPNVVVGGAEDGALVVWRDGPIGYVGWCSERNSMARLVGALKQQGLG